MEGNGGVKVRKKQPCEEFGVQSKQFLGGEDSVRNMKNFEICCSDYIHSLFKTKW